ncbi:MAG: protein kinase [Nannocystaceae bacterium]
MRTSEIEATMVSTGGAPVVENLRSALEAAIFPTPGEPGRIDRFTVLRVLGEGGMGVVYAAYDEELDRRVAIKLVRAEMNDGTQGHSRILREAQAMARVSHPNVVQVYQVDRFAGQIYVAMEFVKGMPLSDWIDAEERGWQEIRDMFVQAGRGLAAAHATGLVHRDFKPDNVLVGNDGRARVLDFGLARAEDLPGTWKAPSNESALMRATTTTNNAFETKLTMDGTIMGTPAYMSPEQHNGEATDARSDQFSFCVALFEAVYRQHPFDGETYQELADAVTAGMIKAPPASSKVPEWFYRALLTGMAVSPAERHPSMDTLLAELSLDSSTPPVRSRWLWPGVTVATAGLAVLITWTLAGGAPTEEDLAHIERLTLEAKAAAAARHWIYPPEDDLRDTAFRRVVELEGIGGDAEKEAQARAGELRSIFADDLVVLGDRYFDDPMTRAFARDYYAQVLLFQPENQKAATRAGVTVGQLADLRQRVTEAEFQEGELVIAESLEVLAEEDPEQRALALDALQEKPGFATATSKMMLGPLVAKLDTGVVARRKAAQAEAARKAEEEAEEERRRLILAAAGPPTPTDPIVPEPVKEPENPKDAGKRPKTPKDKPTVEAPKDPNTDPGDGEEVLDPGKSMELTREAEAARRRGDLTTAEQLFHQALGFWNKNAAALMGLSDINFDRGVFDKAVKFASQAVRNEPKNGDYRLRLGDAYFKMLKYNDARKAYEKADELGNARAKERLERLREKTGE